MLTFQNVMNIDEKALLIREAKLTLISSNIANQDTPNYKARDIDFKYHLENELNAIEETLPLTISNKRHFTVPAGTTYYTKKYRLPVSPSLDGNTVDPSYEKIAFMNNAIRYSSTLAFIKSQKVMLMRVIQGD